MIGIIPIFVKIKNKDIIIFSACAFTSGVIICASIYDLIPESLRYLSMEFMPIVIITLCFIFLIIGIILSMILDKYIDHVSKSSSLFKVGILSMIAIILHNISEDYSCYLSH